MTTQPTAATIAGVEHHTAEVNGTTLHYVSAGASGSPILLVHGFPESWWAFRKLIPLLAQHHRVYAVDLRGFGDSSNAEGDYSTATSAEDLHQLIGDLAAGPMHVLGQDISGGVVYRLAATHPGDVLSLTAVETGLAGFGAEMLADATKGGAWYIGALVTPGIAQLLFAGRSTSSSPVTSTRPTVRWPLLSPRPTPPNSSAPTPGPRACAAPSGSTARC